MDATSSRTRHHRLWRGPAWLAGVDGKNLTNREDVKFYNGLGIAILLAGTVSGLTMVLSVAYVTGVPARRLWLVGLVWTLILINLDRLLLSTTTRRNLLVGLPWRLLLSLAVVALMAVPLELRVFQPEIWHQLQADQWKQTKQTQNGIENFYGAKINAAQSEITRVTSQESALSRRIQYDNFIATCEAKEKACSKTHELGCAVVCHYYLALKAQAVSQLAVLKSRSEPEIHYEQAQIRLLRASDARQKETQLAAISSDRGLLARENALSEVLAAHPGLRYWVWLLRGVVVLVDLMPFILKAMHLLKGSPLEALNAATRRRDDGKAYQLDLATDVEQDRLERQAWADKAVNRVEIEVDRDNRIAAATAGRTGSRDDLYASEDPTQRGRAGRNGSPNPVVQPFA